MKKLATGLAVFAALLWSALVWGGYVLLDQAGAFVAQNAGMFALPPELVGWAQYLFDNFGQGMAVVLWLLGLGLIGVVLLVFNAVASRLAPLEPRSEDRSVSHHPDAPPQPSRSAPSAPVWGRNASRR